MADRTSTVTKTTEVAVWSEEAWRADGPPVGADAPPCALRELSGQELWYRRISVKAGFIWAWRVKNTFVEVRDDEDDCENDENEENRAATAPSEVHFANKEQRVEDACQALAAVQEDGSSSGQQGSPGASIGSLGHPLLCSGACARLAEGCCSLGAACSFCHHPQCMARRKQLDKKNRIAFREMGVRRKVDVMSGILRDKIAKLGLDSRAMWALEQWRRESLVGLQEQEERPCGVRRAEERRVVNTLNSMSISDICFLPCSRDDVFREATESLLSRLRHVASALTSRRDCALVRQ